MSTLIRFNWVELDLVRLLIMSWPNRMQSVFQLWIQWIRVRIQTFCWFRSRLLLNPDPIRSRPRFFMTFLGSKPVFFIPANDVQAPERPLALQGALQTWNSFFFSSFFGTILVGWSGSTDPETLIAVSEKLVEIAVQARWRWRKNSQFSDPCWYRMANQRESSNDSLRGKNCTRQHLPSSLLISPIVTFYSTVYDYI